MLKANNIHPDCITLLPSERESVADLFSATKYVDVIIPRGSAGLIEYVRKNSLVPVMKLAPGFAIFVDKTAKVQNAVNITVNAKVQKTFCMQRD